MKLNIEKFLAGGGLLFSAVANPFANTPSTPSESGSSGSGDSGSKSISSNLLSKELMNKIAQEGLPNEVDAFLQEVAKYERMADMGHVDKLQLYRLQSMANAIVRLSSYLEQAKDRAKENGALDDVAIDQNGYIYTVDKNNSLHKTHISKYNPGKDQAISISELITRREWDPNTVGDREISDVVANSVGIEKINDYIMNIMEKVGTARTKSEAYSDLASIVGREMAKRPTEQEQAAVAQAYNWASKVGLDALFKESNLMASKDVLMAFNYILKVLPKNMRALLEGRYVVQGGNFRDASQNAAEVIWQAVELNNSPINEHSIDFTADMNKAAGTSNDPDVKPQRINLKTLESLTMGTLGKQDLDIINDKNPNLSFTLRGSGVGLLAGFDNTNITEQPMQLVLNNALGALIDLSKVFIGDLKATIAQLNNFVYDGGKVLNVWAPVDSDGNLNLQGAEAFSELQRYIDSQPGMSVAEKNEQLKLAGFDGYYDEQGTFHGLGNMAQFYVMTGITSNKVLDPDDNNYAKEMDSNNSDLEWSAIKQILQQINAENGKDGAKYEIPTKWFGSRTVHVPIFLKLSNTAQADVSMLSSHGPTTNATTYEDAVGYDQMRYNQSRGATVTQPRTSSLFNK